MQLYLQGIGLAGPGLENWPSGRAILSGEIPYVPHPVLLAAPLLLPPTERRRTVPTVRLALAVGEEALRNAGCDPKTMATVFASSGGDGETVHSILEVLASPMREVSPTRFHNSVHNAPSGYWNIAVGSYEPTTSLCGYDASFAVGLLDAGAQAIVDNRDVTLIAYDLPYPAPLARVRTIVSIFGVGLVMSPVQNDLSLARLNLAIERGDDDSAMIDPELERLRHGNPAARSLPLLAAVARREARMMRLEYLPGQCVAVTVDPL